MPRLAYCLMMLMGCSSVFASGLPPKPRAFKNELVDRLVQNATAYLQKHPDSVQAYFVLGEIHHRAYQDKRTVLPVEPGGAELPTLIPKGVPLLREPLVPGAKPQLGPHDTEMNQNHRKEHLVRAVHHFSRAVQLDEKNGAYHIRMADALLELAGKAEETLPLTRPIAPRSDLSSQRQNEIKSQINGLCTDYVGVRPMMWLLENGVDAEPLIAERLLKAHDYEKPRLQRVLAEHWKALAIRHYAHAHNLAWNRDVDSYNPAHGAPWDGFVSLRAGKLYMQLTALRPNEETQRQSQRIEETFAALNKKTSEYKGPVR